MNAWPLVPLREVLTKSEEWVRLDPSAKYRQVTVKLWGQGVVERSVVTGQEIGSETRLAVRAHQFLISRIDARNGANGLVPESLDGAVVSNDFPAFTVNSKRLDCRFLGWYSKTARFVDDCKAASEGTTNRVRLKEDRFYSIAMPLPPITEQRRIVERISLLSNRATEIDRLRADTQAETQILWKRILATTIADRTSDECQLEEVCTAIIDNLHSNPVYANAGVPCVRSPDVGWGTLNLISALRTDEGEYLRRIVRGKPEVDDIVLVREGGGTGKAALVLPGQRFSLGQRVMMLRPNTSKILPKFFLYQILSPLVQEDQIQPVSKGSASPHLNIGALRRFRLRLPSLEKQHQLVARIDQIRALLNAVTERQVMTAHDIESLMPSILNHAFSGQL